MGRSRFSAVCEEVGDRAPEGKSRAEGDQQADARVGLLLGEDGCASRGKCGLEVILLHDDFGKDGVHVHLDGGLVLECFCGRILVGHVQHDCLLRHLKPATREWVAGPRLRGCSVELAAPKLDKAVDVILPRRCVEDLSTIYTILEEPTFQQALQLPGTWHGTPETNLAIAKRKLEPAHLGPTKRGPHLELRLVVKGVSEVHPHTIRCRGQSLDTVVQADTLRQPHRTPGSLHRGAEPDPCGSDCSWCSWPHYRRCGHRCSRGHTGSCRGLRPTYLHHLAPPGN